MSRFLWCLPTFAALMLANSGTAVADLQFCNRTDIELFSAVGEKPGSEYLSTGWYHIKPDKCVIVIDEDLADRTYWAYAINSKRNYETAGDTDFCVLNDKAFAALKLGGCSGQSDRRKEAFATVDVGNEKHYRVEFQGRAGHGSASIKTYRTLDDSGKNGAATTRAGGGCTAAVNKVCGDPSGIRVARADATRIVPDLSQGVPEGTTARMLLLARYVFVHPSDVDNIRGTARWIAAEDVTTLDPHASAIRYRPVASMLVEQIYEPLVRRTANGSAQPALAESWQSNASGEWTLKLRRGVIFHDDRPLSPDDVVYSVDRFNAAYSAAGFQKRILRAESVDADTVRLHTSLGAEAALVDALDEILILSKAWAAPHAPEYIAVHPVGTGPFKYKEIEPGRGVTLVRNDNWWGLRSTPTLYDSVRFRTVWEPATIVNELTSGEAQFGLLHFTLADSDDVRRLLAGSLFTTTSAANSWWHVSPEPMPPVSLGFVDPSTLPVPPIWSPDFAAAVSRAQSYWRGVTP